jgi:hypothetical protein
VSSNNSTLSSAAVRLSQRMPDSAEESAALLGGDISDQQKSNAATDASLATTGGTSTTYRFRRSGIKQSVVEVFPPPLPLERGIVAAAATPASWGRGGEVRVVIKARQRDYNGEWENRDWVRATIVL